MPAVEGELDVEEIREHVLRIALPCTSLLTVHKKIFSLTYNHVISTAVTCILHVCHSTCVTPCTPPHVSHSAYMTRSHEMHMPIYDHILHELTLSLTRERTNSLADSRTHAHPQNVTGAMPC